MKLIHADECRRILSTEKKVILIDIREKYELAEFHTPDALHIPMAEMESNKDIFEEYTKVVLMCKTGKRAEALSNFLITEYGYSNVLTLDGGIIAYLENTDVKP